MSMTTLLWGTGLACALGGAVAGTALGSAPILDRPSYGSFDQSHVQTASASDDREMPDHYPLVTRQGTVPVAELSDRGLFSQARYRADYRHADHGPGASQQAADHPAEDGAQWAAREEAPIIGDAPHTGAVLTEAEPAAPLALSDSAASLTEDGQAKSVDVQAVLAMR